MYLRLMIWREDQQIIYHVLSYFSQCNIFDIFIHVYNGFLFFFHPDELDFLPTGSFPKLFSFALTF